MVFARASPAGSIFMFLFSSASVFGFNLDTKVPIVKVGPELSHFGYSVAQHKTTIPGAPVSALNKYESWILVGAPKGENLQPGTNRSGALFKCPLTSRLNDCQQVQTDGLRNSAGKLMPPLEDEIKDDQWMGVTLKSQGEGGNILVCAHRYQLRGIGEENFRWGYGLCYRLSNDFQYNEEYEPCKGQPINLEHEQFGYCQAGTSGLILEDEIVLGIPGTYTWRGAIHTRNITDPYLVRDKTPYFGVYTDDDSPVNKYSYLGYSVAAGRFFGDKLSYVAGAPRSRETGQVIFFSREKMGVRIMNYDLILNGEMFASSFGFEVLAMDVNGDGRDDLIVSAPFYFTKQSSGAVYVYLNDRGISNETPFTRLEGAPGESRFGFSMTSLGDLNLDGYNDLAVGAPYEGRGAIYIYLGSENGIIKEPSQVIRAEDMPGPPYDAFGYSLSGGMDLDNNNYNDLLTSSFCSDRVVLLRARPIIDIQTQLDTKNLQNINPTKPGCPEDRNSEETCFSFNACFKMKNEAGTETFLRLQYNISERFYNDQLTNRIRFHRAQVDRQSVVEQIISLRPENMGTFQCSREIVYVKKGQRDVLRPVRFKLSYEIFQRDPKPVRPGQDLPDINDYPILNQKEAVRYFEANFAKDCGSDDVCISDLNVVGELDLEKQVGMDYFVLELGKRQLFTLNVVVSNNGEPAYIPSLFVSHDEGIDLSIRESETGSYQCFPSKSGLLKCNLDNPLVNTTGPLKLVFKPSGLTFKNKFMDLRVWANSTSEEAFRDDNEITFSVEVKRRAEISISGSAEPEQVFYSGEVVGESAIESIEEIGTSVTHKYLVDNRGPWKVDELKVLIHWPYQVENNKKQGKWLLYMTDYPEVDGDGECDVDPNLINPLGFTRFEVVGSEVVESEVTSHPLRQPPTTKSPVVDSTGGIIVSNSSVITYQNSTSINISSSSSNTTSFGSSSSGSTSSSSSSSSFGSQTGNDRFGRHPSREGGTITREEITRVNRKYTTDGSEDWDDLDAISDIRTFEEGGRTYVNGYDKNGKIVWSSRDVYTTDRRDKVYDKSSSYKYDSNNYDRHGGVSNEIEDENARLLTSKMNIVENFQVSQDDNGPWVNGYDKYNNLIWSSRDNGGYHDRSRKGDKNYVVNKQQSFSEHTVTGGADGNTRREWSSRVEDQDGVRSYSGSSVSDRHGTRVSGSAPPDNTHWDYDRRNHEEFNWIPNDEPLHGENYSRAVVDPATGKVKVYKKKVFSRKSRNDWTSEGGTRHRVKREREFVVKSEAIKDLQTGQTKQVVTFRCDGDVPTAKCFTFQCTIRNLDADQSASIRIPARLWNSTLVEDYARVSHVNIKSKGELILPNEIRTDQDTSDDVAYATTLAYSNMLEQLPSGDVPWWVILISVLAGLILLILIAYVLWKLGFFKRRRPDPTYSGNINRGNGYN